LNIIFSNIVESRTHTKTKRRSYENTKTKTKTKSVADLINKIEAEFKKPVNYLYFTLGVLSEFFSPVEAAYRSIKSNPANALQFAEQCKAAFLPGPESNLPGQFQQMETLMNGEANKKEFCEKTRDTIKDYYVESHKEDATGLGKAFNFMGGVTYGVRGAFTSSMKFCDQIKSNKAPNTHKIILKKYNDWATFMKQCLYFDSISCSQFEPDSFGIQNFARKATKYYQAVNKMADCLKGHAAGSVLASVFNRNNLLKEGLLQGLSAFANVLTLGVWGGLNGAYHFVQLGLKIHEFQGNPSVDTAFRLGGIVGRAIKIVLSLVGIPTVRRLKKKKFRKN